MVPSVNREKSEIPPSENAVVANADIIAEVSTDPLSETSKENIEASDVPLEEAQNEKGDDEAANLTEVPVTDNGNEITTSSTIDDASDLNSNNRLEKPFVGNGDDNIVGDLSQDTELKVDSADKDASMLVDQGELESATVKSEITGSTEKIDRDPLPDPSQKMKPFENKINASTMKIQEQLDEVYCVDIRYCLGNDLHLKSST